MAFTDPIGDMFSRIRNGQMRFLNSIVIPSSTFRKNILEELDLKYPSYQLNNLKYGELEKNTSLSMRISPQVIGVGLLEAIEESDILAKQDINDEDNDGISGLARIVND